MREIEKERKNLLQNVISNCVYRNFIIIKKYYYSVNREYIGIFLNSILSCLLSKNQRTS